MQGKREESKVSPSLGLGHSCSPLRTESPQRPFRDHLLVLWNLGPLGHPQVGVSLFISTKIDPFVPAFGGTSHKELWLSSYRQISRFWKDVWFVCGELPQKSFVLGACLRKRESRLRKGWETVSILKCTARSRFFWKTCWENHYFYWQPFNTTERFKCGQMGGGVRGPYDLGDIMWPSQASVSTALKWG